MRVCRPCRRLWAPANAPQQCPCGGALETMDPAAAVDLVRERLDAFRAPTAIGRRTAPSAAECSARWIDRRFIERMLEERRIAGRA